MRTLVEFPTVGLDLCPDCIRRLEEGGYLRIITDGGASNPNMSTSAVNYHVFNMMETPRLRLEPLSRTNVFKFCQALIRVGQRNLEAYLSLDLSRTGVVEEWGWWSMKAMMNGSALHFLAFEKKDRVLVGHIGIVDLDADHRKASIISFDDRYADEIEGAFHDLIA